MSQRSQAFVKGGCGCLLAFAAMAAVAVVFGGRARINCGGMAMLFIIGGIMGLLGYAVFRKEPPREDPRFSAAPPRGPVWTCVNCGTDNDRAAEHCRNCREPR